MSEPLHILYPSAPRRLIGLITQGLLGLILIWLALVHPPSNPFWQVFLIVFGGGSLILAVKGWQKSSQGIVLDETGLWQEDGTPIAPLEEIASVDRALFSFKPSNGFLIRLQRPLGRAWAPGMWWRVGRRVGIGGVTSGAETKIVADALSFMVAERDADDPQA